MAHPLWFPPDVGAGGSIPPNVHAADQLIWKQGCTVVWCRRVRKSLDTDPREVQAACSENDLRVWMVENSPWLLSPIWGNNHGRAGTAMLLVFSTWLKYAVYVYAADDDSACDGPESPLDMCIEMMAHGDVPFDRIFDIVDVLRARAWSRFDTTDDLEWARHWSWVQLPRMLALREIVEHCSMEFDFLAKLVASVLPLMRDVYVFRELDTKAVQGLDWVHTRPLCGDLLTCDILAAHRRLLAWAHVQIQEMDALSATGSVHGAFREIREWSAVASLWTGDKELTFADGNYADDWRSIFLYHRSSARAAYWMRMLLAGVPKGADATSEHIGSTLGDMPTLQEIMFVSEDDHTLYTRAIRESAWIVLWDQVLGPGCTGFGTYGMVEQSGQVGSEERWSDYCCLLHAPRIMYGQKGTGWSRLCQKDMPLIVNAAGGWFVIIQHTKVCTAAVLACGNAIESAFLIWAWATLWLGEQMQAQENATLLMPSGYSVQPMLIYLFTDEPYRVDTAGRIAKGQ